jgi:AGCS family alanine or glycine:cation symporter
MEAFGMNLEMILKGVDDVVWGPGMIFLLVGTGVYLTIRLGFVQFRHLGHAIKCITGKYDDPNEEGDITHFRALATALSATIGTGNIAGVATAIAGGGPGAVFWMWVTALVGMATKFTSCSLAVQFRNIHEDGSASGGPMYYIRKGFAPPLLAALLGPEQTRRIAVWLGVLFAMFAVIASFGIGNMVQANSVVDGLSYMIPESWQRAGITLGGNYRISYLSLAIGVVLAGLVGLVTLGGIKRIAGVAGRLVPTMCVIYVAGSLMVLALNAHKIPGCLALIFKYAFTPYAAAGGLMGYVVKQTMHFGVARGVFSNESGLGSAPMAHAAAKTHEMVREGFVAMLGPFIDTIVICSMTALVILITNAHQSELNGAQLTAEAFNKGLFGYGHYIVGVGLVLFAYSTIISWSYYGDRCAEFLFGPKAVIWYRYLYIVFIVVGAIGALRVVWSLADIFNALMALPNLIGLIALAGLVAAKKRDYVRRLKEGLFD